MNPNRSRGDFSPVVEFTSDAYLKRRHVFDVVFAKNEEKKEKLASFKNEERAVHFMQQELSLYNIDIYAKYVIGPPVRDSKIRSEQETQIAEDLDAGVPVLIRGNWRAGKTSMVLSLAKHRENNTPGLFLDASMMAGEKSLEKVEKNLARDVASFILKLEGQDKANDIFEKEDALAKQIMESGTSPIDFLNKYLEKSSKKAFLIVDEIVGLAEEPELLKYFASLRRLENIKLGLVLHRIAKYEEMFKETFDSFKTYFVEPINFADAAILMRKPLENTPISFSDDAVVKALEITGGRPWELNILCATVLGDGNYDKEPKLVYTAEDFTQVNSSYGFISNFGGVYRNYEKIFGYSLNDKERELLIRLEEVGEISTDQIDGEQIQPLIDTTYVVRDNVKGVYRINGELFRKYIYENHHQQA